MARIARNYPPVIVTWLKKPGRNTKHAERTGKLFTDSHAARRHYTKMLNEGRAPEVHKDSVDLPLQPMTVEDGGAR